MGNSGNVIDAYFKDKLQRIGFWENLTICKTLIKSLVDSEDFKDDFFLYLKTEDKNLSSCEILSLLCNNISNNLVTTNTSDTTNKLGNTLSNFSKYLPQPQNDIFMNRELGIAVKGLNTCYNLLEEYSDIKLLTLSPKEKMRAEKEIETARKNIAEYKKEITSLLTSQSIIWQEQKATISQEIIVLSGELQKEKEKSNPSTLKIWKDKAKNFVNKYKFQFLFLGLSHIDSIAEAVNLDISADKMEMFKEILGEVKDIIL